MDVSYDANGNISALTRENSSGGILDAFTYVYSGNRLSSLSGSSSYGYDGNGNTTYDGKRGIGVGYFEEIDLPGHYARGTDTVRYEYDATGLKWGKSATLGGNTSTMDYYGEFIYRDGTLDRVLTSEGYYDPTGADYHYHLKDHLGNTRMTIHYDGSSATAHVEQEIEYYPFGKMFSANNTAENKYLYNGKELQNEFFENYDYGARFYDPELGRFHSVDPLASDYPSWTPYHYVHNNPIVLIDPTGMSADWYQSDAGNLIWQDKSDATITINGEEFKNIGKSVSIGNSEDRFINYYENVPISLSNAPVNAGAKVLNNQGLKGQLIEKNSPLSERSKSDLFFSSIHNATGQAAEIMFEAAMWVAPMPKIGLLGKGASWLNKTLATSYLSKAGQLANFKAVEGFSLGVGQKTFKYHNSFTAASRTPWSSPTLFKSQGSAFNSLALDYPKTSNFAQARFQTKRFGVFVRGTAQRQGMTFGGGTQLLKTSFGSYSKPIVLPW